MEFGWDDTQSKLYDRVLSFARDRLSTAPTPGASIDNLRLCGDFGLLGLCVDRRYGGMGLDALSSARAVEGFGRGASDMGLVFSVCAHLFACVSAIQDFADDRLKQEVLPRLASGEWLGANAITEMDAGSDVFALKTRAVREGDEYVIDGAKSFVTNAPAADLFLVYALTDPAHGYLGVSAFAVPRTSPGIVVGPPFDKIGLRSTPSAELRLEKCRVPVSNIVGERGQGALIFRASMIWERACLFAAYVGMMEEQLEKTILFAKERRQFGKPIGKHQAVAHRIADMKLRLESARLLVYRACWLKDRGTSSALESSLAKLAVSEAAIQSGIDAIWVHGGAGVKTETGIAQGLLDALPSAIFSGTSDIQRDLIARELLL